MILIYCFHRGLGGSIRGLGGSIRGLGGSIRGLGGSIRGLGGSIVRWFYWDYFFVLRKLLDTCIMLSKGAKNVDLV